MVRADLQQKRQLTSLGAKMQEVKAKQALQSAVHHATAAFHHKIKLTQCATAHKAASAAVHQPVATAAPKPGPKQPSEGLKKRGEQLSLMTNIQKQMEANATPQDLVIDPVVKAEPKPEAKVKAEPEADVVVIDLDPVVKAEPEADPVVKAEVKAEPNLEVSKKPWERRAALASRDADREARGKLQPVGKRPQMAEPVDTSPPKTIPRLKGSVAQAAASSSSAQLPSRYSAMAKMKRTAAKSMASRGPDVGKRGWGQTVFSF